LSNVLSDDLHLAAHVLALLFGDLLLDDFELLDVGLVTHLQQLHDNHPLLLGLEAVITGL
jgi:hypothetical protein